MTLRRETVSQSFERALRGVYGHSRFSADEIGEQSAFRVREDGQHVLRPVMVYTRALTTQRAAHGLGDRWEGQFFLMQQISGQLGVHFDGGAPVVLRAGDLLLMNPYQGCEFASRRANEVAVIPMPFDAAGGEAKVLAACGRRVDRQAAVGAVLGSALAALLAQRRAACAEERAVVGEVIHQLLGRLVAATPAGEQDLAADGLLRRAHRFALKELANPALSPDAIALGLGVSRRQLYRAFAEAGQTPASWLWSLRTEQAHLRLTSPQECAKSLTQLAFDVGFNDMAHFSRSYRARFGCTPRQARLNAAGGAGG